VPTVAGARGKRHLVAIALALLVALALAPAARAAAAVKITEEKRVGPREVELTISTPAFTAPTHVDVDLPAGYGANPTRRWPVTYFLPGTTNPYRTFNDLVGGLKLTESYPSLVVSPGGDAGYWSDWYNSGAFGPPMYETFVIDQLIPLIDGHFRTIRDHSGRAVTGVSMGGYGALMDAARHPDLFSAAASVSGAVDSNLTANGAVLSISPTFQGAQPDAIYGPRTTQEVRWHGHNPTDLAANLRGLDIQVRSANGTPNPALGEQLASPDAVSCTLEAGVHMASVDMHDALDALKIPHVWRDYGPGCHTWPNFKREFADTLASFKGSFANPPHAPKSFDYLSIEPAFDIWGWHIAADPKRALEFIQLRNVSSESMTFVGSGTTAVTSPPLYRGLRRVDVAGAALKPDATGRVGFKVDLGPADADQQYTPGATTRQTSRTVKLAPYAVVKITRALATRRHVQICAHALGGEVTARIGSASTRTATVTLGARTVCRNLAWTRRAARVALQLVGRDRFGHAVTGHRTIRVG
jgi:S-formylglutathione hydrolase FrmB